MEDRPGKTESRKTSRRQYSAAFKARVVEECGQTGVWKAEIARKYGIHTSVVYRWVAVTRQTEQAKAGLRTAGVQPTKASVPITAEAVGPTPEQATQQKTAAAGLPKGFIPIATGATSSEVIQIEVHSAASQVHIRWPTRTAPMCLPTNAPPDSKC